MNNCVAVGTYPSVAQKYHATVVSQWVKQIWKDKSSPSLKGGVLALLKLISKSYAQVIPHLNKKE